MDYSEPTRKIYAEPSLRAFLYGLVSKRWLLLTSCCLFAHVFPYVLCAMEEEEDKVACVPPDDRPDFASIVFVIAVATALADLRLFPRFYRPPPPSLLLVYDIVVSVVATRWALWAAWQPLRSLTHAVARALERRCTKAMAPPGWVPGRRRTRDAMWAALCDAASPLPPASRFADGMMVGFALAAYAAVLHATELFPRLTDYYEDWTHARQYLAMERCKRIVYTQRPALPKQVSS